VLIVRRAKIVLYSLWYHHTETSEWSKINKIIKIIKTQFYKYEHMVKYIYLLLHNRMAAIKLSDRGEIPLLLRELLLGIR